MSANQPSLPGAHEPRSGARWWAGLPSWIWPFWIIVAIVGIGSAVGIVLVSHRTAVSSGPSSPIARWAAGVKRAPNFNLVDQAGKPLSMTAFHGRPVIVTFIDPTCRNLCPREASIISQAAAKLGSARPAIVAVSVDPWSDSTHNFQVDAGRWHLAPGWLWGVGSYARLARVWKSYGVAVVVAKHTYAGVAIRKITHTEAAYVVDPSGHERALLLYPFTTKDVVSAVKGALSGSGS